MRIDSWQPWRGVLHRRHAGNSAVAQARLDGLPQHACALPVTWRAAPPCLRHSNSCSEASSGRSGENGRIADLPSRCASRRRERRGHEKARGRIVSPPAGKPGQRRARMARMHERTADGARSGVEVLVTAPHREIRTRRHAAAAAGCQWNAQGRSANARPHGALQRPPWRCQRPGRSGTGRPATAPARHCSPCAASMTPAVLHPASSSTRDFDRDRNHARRSGWPPHAGRTETRRPRSRCGGAVAWGDRSWPSAGAGLRSANSWQRLRPAMRLPVAPVRPATALRNRSSCAVPRGDPGRPD